MRTGKRKIALFCSELNDFFDSKIIRLLLKLVILPLFVLKNYSLSTYAIRFLMPVYIVQFPVNILSRRQNTYCQAHILIKMEQLQKSKNKTMSTVL